MNYTKARKGWNFNAVPFLTVVFTLYNFSKKLIEVQCSILKLRGFFHGTNTSTLFAFTTKKHKIEGNIICIDMS